MKHTFKRTLALVLALVMILGMAPTMTLHAHAATLSGLTDTTIALNYSNNLGTWLVQGSVKWTAEGNSLTCVATGKDGLTANVSASSELTITNNGEAGKLSFDWKLEGNGSVSGILSGTSGSYSADLAAGASTKLKVASGTGNYSCTLTLSNLKLLRDSGAITSTFLPASNGSYTVDGTAITEAKEFSKSALESYVLVATPASGYQFLGWYNETADKYESYESAVSINLEVAATMYPVFAREGAAIFSVGSTRYADLNEAINVALNGSTKTVVVAKDGTLPAGDYTIPTGITLLVPFNSINTTHTSGVDTAADGLVNDVQGTYATPYAFRKLTMASGANITVNGALNVGGEHHAGDSASSGNSKAGSPTGPVGFIDMASGSTITVNNTGKLYCWGFITGSGTVTANSGATVYENMQISDFRGGSATTSVYNGRSSHKVFPFSQYYVQNIEVPLIMHPNATVYAATTVYMSSNAFSSTVEFIGANGLFCVSEGTVTKAYDGSKDRLNLIVDGNVGINKISMDVSGMTITSTEYVLPINSNITITVKKGSICDLTQDLALLPGSQVSVEQGATLNVPSGYSIYVYDGDQWNNGGYVFTGYQWIPVIYAPGKTYTRTLADVTTDAKVDLNGALVVNGGAYTTAGGANIISSEGTGTVEMDVAPDSSVTKTYQYAQASSSWAEIPVTPLKLHNSNDFAEYTETAEAKAGDIYYWNSTCSGWSTCADDHDKAEEITDVNCTQDGIKHIWCKVCGHEFENSVEPAWGHFFGDDASDVVVTPPTCTEQGYTTYYCGVYGEYGCTGTEVTDYVDPLGHDYSVKGETVDPTCTAQGYTVYTCANGCGTTENRDYTDKAAHNYETVVTAPNCTAAGYTTYTCSVCGDSYTGDEVAALGHTEEIIPGTAATCTATGLTDGKKCSVCGVTTVAQEVIPALPHTEETIPGKDATCTETGLTEGKKCSVCGTVITAQVEIPALGHDYEEEITENAGCTTEGLKTFTCKNCGHSYTEAISATGHTEVADEAVEATCTTAGKTAGSHCSVCSANLSGNEEIPALGHSYAAVVTAPTCTVAGYTTYTCSNCGNSYVADEVAALGHTEVTVAGKDATCTETGLTEGKKCSVCGETTKAQEEIPALGHDWNEDEVVDPTCTEAGYTKKICKVCGTEERFNETPVLGHTEEIIPGKDATCTETGLTEGKKCSVCGDIITEQTTINAAGHKYDSVVTEPTCTAAGYTTHTCTVCGDNYVSDQVAKLDHNYETPVETIEPTCTEKGYTVYQCECGATENRDFVAPLDHDYKSVVTAPGCETQGYTTHSCSRCDSTYIDSETAATGHSYGDWVVTEPDCLTDGKKAQTCANCGHVVTEVIPHTGHTEETVPGKDATCTETGLTEGKHCSACGTVLVEQEVIPATGVHNYEDGKCTMCGEADPDAIQIVDHQASLILEGMIHVKQYWGFPGLTAEEVKAAKSYMVVTTYGAESTTEYTVDLVYNGSYKGVQECYGLTQGIASKYMVDNMTMQAFIEINGKTYASEKKEYSVLTYCEGRFQNSKDENLKSALVALLNYGAAAQTYFKYETDNLINAKLETYVEEYGLNADYLNLNWQDDYLTPLKQPSAEMTVNFGSTNTLIDNGNSLYLEGAISVNYYYGIGNDNSKFQDSTAVMYFWTEEDYSALEAAGMALAKENASYFVEDAEPTYSTKYGYEYAFLSDQIASNEMGETIYAVMCITDSDGVEHCTGVVVYSPEFYAEGKLTDDKAASIDPLCEWLVTYGERATVYFAK